MSINLFKKLQTLFILQLFRTNELNNSLQVILVCCVFMWNHSLPGNQYVQPSDHMTISHADAEYQTLVAVVRDKHYHCAR